MKMKRIIIIKKEKFLEVKKKQLVFPKKWLKIIKWKN